MKRKNLKKCSNFKAIEFNDARHNRHLSSDCKNCVYFSTKNCRLEASDEIEPEFDFI